MNHDDTTSHDYDDRPQPRRRRKRHGRLALLFAFLLGIGAAVGAAALADRWPHGRLGHAVDYISYRYDLSGEQRERLDDVADVLRELRSLRVGLRGELRDELRAALDAPAVDQERLIALINDKTRLIEDNAPRLIGAVAGFVDSLYPDQKQRLLEKLDRRLGGERRWR